jgi:hypothetical protein
MPFQTASNLDFCPFKSYVRGGWETGLFMVKWLSTYLAYKRLYIP